ncbi:MAG: IS21 family transposase, partial [Propionibacterium sp.]|nr:IS21 family transposase [Propionibacterium sp.]
SGDVAGTQELIDVLLLHRSLPAEAVIAGITSALSVGAVSADVVAVEARRHSVSHTAPAPQCGGTVVNLPPRRHTDSNSLIAALPADTRPLPSVTAYDELLRRRQPDPASATAEAHHHTPTGTP